MFSEYHSQRDRVTSPETVLDVTNPLSATQEKISALHEKFADIQNQSDDETKNRIERDVQKLNVVKEKMQKLEQTLNSEIKRRVEANKALQALFESQIAAVQEKLEIIFFKKLDDLQENVDSLSGRMVKIENEFSIVCKQYTKEIEQRSSQVARTTNSMQNAFEDEKLDRKHREHRIVKQLGEHETRVNTAIDVLAANRDRKYQKLRGELEEMRLSREKGDDKFQTFILEEVADLKKRLMTECQTREQADDDIVQGLNHYTKCLQDALRIVNQH